MVSKGNWRALSLSLPSSLVRSMTVGCLTVLLPWYWRPGPDVPGCDEMEPSGLSVPTILPVCRSISSLTAFPPFGMDVALIGPPNDDCVERWDFSITLKIIQIMIAQGFPPCLWHKCERKRSETFHKKTGN